MKIPPRKKKLAKTRFNRSDLLIFTSININRQNLRIFGIEIEEKQKNKGKIEAIFVVNRLTFIKSEENEQK